MATVVVGECLECCGDHEEVSCCCTGLESQSEVTIELAGVVDDGLACAGGSCTGLNGTYAVEVEGRLGGICVSGSKDYSPIDGIICPSTPSFSTTYLEFVSFAVFDTTPSEPTGKICYIQVTFAIRAPNVGSGANIHTFGLYLDEDETINCLNGSYALEYLTSSIQFSQQCDFSGATVVVTF